MTETSVSPIRILVELGKVDIALARILAEKKQFENKITEKKKEYAQTDAICKGRLKILAEKKARYDKEESSIEEEREKLVTRRKTLASLNNYKVQQTAEKDIEHANRQLSLREEALYPILQEIESGDAEIKKHEEGLRTIKSTIEELKKDYKETLPTLEVRESEYMKEREELEKKVLPAYLENYKKVILSHFADPVAPLNLQAKSCGGCHMQLRPQILVEVQKGQAPINCPGCGRILYLEDSTKEE